MVAHKHKVSAADKALIERAEAVGSIAYRDDAGDVVAMIIHNPERLSLADRKRLREMIDKADARFVKEGGKIVRMPNPANLMGGEKYFATKKMDVAQFEDCIRVARFSFSERRVEKLKRHAELTEIAAKLACKLPVKEGQLDADFHAIIPNDPFWAELADAEKLALAYDAAPRVIRDHKRQAAAKRGGKRAASTARARAASWHADCADRAREMLRQGRAPRELTGILAQRFNKTSRQVRTALQAAGVLESKKGK